MITREELKTRLTYYPDTGVWLWKKCRSNVRDSGSIAGWINTQGYRMIHINGKDYRAHRLAFLWMLGEVLSEDIEVDHKNGTRDDNRWDNLRKATHAENHQNKPIHKNNTSGYSGVSFVCRKNLYRSYIRIHGKQIHLGLFTDPEEAHQAYLDAKRKIHLFQPIPRQ